MSLIQLYQSQQCNASPMLQHTQGVCLVKPFSVVVMLLLLTPQQCPSVHHTLNIFIFQCCVRLRPNLDEQVVCSSCSVLNVVRKPLAEQHALQEAVLWSRTPSSNRKAPIPNQAYYCLLGHLYAAARLELMRMGETLHLSQYTPAGPVHGNVSPVIQCSCAD